MINMRRIYHTIENNYNIVRLDHLTNIMFSPFEKVLIINARISISWQLISLKTETITI